ncbi:peptidase M3A/M3B [Lasiosphaeria miniovina]|uniref:Peptidase M3A/M3B n=1 Tax=Lasiosphaeria miniovina TaxID=1954250 RepID=A0AA39ZUQ8_9PEZI|nr:peptidase M3A/M3B [Lasiosphaeria miniovina]KAK0703932.1 peptidase M3A/M3B [Lasiosphaeria miniovina]
MAWVARFLDQLKHALVPRGRVLLDICRLCRGVDLGMTLNQALAELLPPWDYAYYRERLCEERGLLDHDSSCLAPYLSVEHTVPAMLSVVGELFGVRFDRMTPETWDPRLTLREHVDMFAVWDEGVDEHAFLGYLYLDLFWHHGKTKTGMVAYTRPICVGHTATASGTRKYPSVCLVLNLAPTNPVLGFHGVRTFAHELGHCMHVLFQQVTHAITSGRHLGSDYVEIPSHVFEHMFLQRDMLKKIGRHRAYLDADAMRAWSAAHPDATCPPPERIPDELLQTTADSLAFLTLYGNLGSL